MEFVRTEFLSSPHDPFKDPSWRWRRCGYLLQHSRRPISDLDDDTTRQAWLFRRALEQYCHDETDRQQLAREAPDLVEAHSVYTSDPPMRRWEVEARLLGGGDDDAIAARCGLSAAGVRAFHDLFYEVRPHLQAGMYVTNVLIGEKVHYGLKPDNHEQLLKLFGYGGLLNSYLDYYYNPPVLPASLATLDLPALEKLRSRLRTHLLVLTLTTPARDVSPATWLQISEQFAASRRGSGGDGETVPGPPRPTLDLAALLAAQTPASGTAAGLDETADVALPDLLPLVPQQVASAVRALAPTTLCG
jgi:hypothetical protein